MSKFNFDSEFFRRVIAKCEETNAIPSLSQTVKKAVEVFYDEYDYYPNIGVYAPGTFTIMGDHLEYLRGNLVQAALPLGAVVVGKSLCSIKCKLITTSKDVEGLRKSIFSIYHYRKNLKVFPEWVNHIKGVINYFPNQDIKGFDAVIHSNVPVCQGYGSSAALQVCFYTFLEAVMGLKSCEKKEEKGNLCALAETQCRPPSSKIGLCNNFTSSVALPNACVKINCRTKEVSTFEMRDINIMFLLTYPKFEIELNDRDCVFQRELELKLAAKLLGLEEIIDATPYHLDETSSKILASKNICKLSLAKSRSLLNCEHVKCYYYMISLNNCVNVSSSINILAKMEDPSKETVKQILREYCSDENYIEEFVENLFYFPKIDSDLDRDLDEGLYGENYLGESSFWLSEKSASQEILQDEDHHDEETPRTPCFPKTETKWTEKPKTPTKPSVSYIQQRMAELCADKARVQQNLSEAVCEEINCLGGLDNLSAASDLTVCGRLLRRVRHVVTENMRSLDLSDLISQLNYEELGVKLIQSHLSLKIDFEVSCPTLDGLVQLAIDSDRVYGAKMTSGGGTLTLLHKSVAEEFIKKVTEKFGNKFQFYLVFPSSGARILNLGMKHNPKSTLSNVFLNQEELLQQAIESFKFFYKYRPTHGAYAPAVLNLLGDHADYNHGFSLSIALNMMTIIVGGFNGTMKVRIATTEDVGNENAKTVFHIYETKEEVKAGKVKWAKLLRGVLSYFKDLMKGFDCLIESSLPGGFGIASKPTLVLAFYTFLENLSEERHVSAAKKAHDCMLILQEFNNSVIGVGENTVAIKSKEDFFVFFDSRSTLTTLIPFQNPSVIFLLTFVEIKIKYNQAVLYRRMEECYEVAKALGGKTLRCLTLEDLDALKECKKKVREKSIRRAVHVITENERALKAAEALKNNDFQELGELMIASHNSLRDNYEVIDPKIDRLVASAMEVDGVLGSKMPSSGYMTCTISLVKRWAVDDLIEYLQNSAPNKLSFYLVNPYKGCDAIKVKEYIDKFSSPQFAFQNIFPL